MESKGALAGPPGLCGESKPWNPKSCLWSCLLLAETLLPLVPELAFPGGKDSVPEKVHRSRMQEPLSVTLVDDSGIAIMGSGTHPSGGCVSSFRENAWAFIPLKARLERNVGVCGVTFFLNSWWHLCLKVGAHTSIPPCLKGKQDSKIESQRTSYPGIIGNRHAMHCVVLTRRRLSASSRDLWCIKYQGLYHNRTVNLKSELITLICWTPKPNQNVHFFLNWTTNPSCFDLQIYLTKDLRWLIRNTCNKTKI